MTSLRLLADDLTGALASAADFIALIGPVRTFWHGAILAEPPDNVALDSGTRALDAGGGITFKKIDSLLRSHTHTNLLRDLLALERRPS